jgi:hypothetical protein
MSAIIYKTINTYNEKNGIFPYLYIGSDQHNKKNYFGSNKDLIKDIKKIGKHYFEKEIICEFTGEISNVLLREIESEIQKLYGVAEDIKFYNKTNSSHKGYIETENEKKERLEKLKIGRLKWLNSLTDDEKNELNNKNGEYLIEFSKKNKGKTYEQIFGEEKGKLKKIKHTGSNNGMSRKVMNLESGKIFDTMLEAMKFYNIKKYETLRKRCLKGNEFVFV